VPLPISAIESGIITFVKLLPAKAYSSIVILVSGKTIEVIDTRAGLGRVHTWKK
jgi:hypothetical protein